jgi:L-asparaginase II
VVCVVKIEDDGTPKTVYSAGDTKQVFYPRSAMKYTQILPLFETGTADHFGFSEEEIAIMCASHQGEPRHLEVVRGILSKIGASEDDLTCGGHTPGCEESAFQYVRDGAPTPFRGHIYNNCSGKHAGFLAVAKHIGAPLKGYLDMSHPVQQLIRSAVSDIFQIPLDELYAGIDGCSAPAYVMDAYHGALGFARLASWRLHPDANRREAISRMISAITSFPRMVRGANTFCTDIMAAGRGNVIGKIGAAGVYTCAVIDQRLGFSVKIDDGATGPQFNVAMKFLCESGAIDINSISTDSDVTTAQLGGRLQKYLETPLNTCVGTSVGSLFVNPEVLQSLKSSE